MPGVVWLGYFWYTFLEGYTAFAYRELLSEGSEVQILLSTVGIGMISRNCEIIPICLCNGKKSLRFTLGIANEIGIRIMKISQQKSTYFQNRKMNSSKKLWRRCCFRQYG